MTNQAHVFSAIRFFVLLDNVVSQPGFPKKEIIMWSLSCSFLSNISYLLLSMLPNYNEVRHLD